MATDAKHPVQLALADALHEHLVRCDTSPSKLSAQLQVTVQYTHKLLRGDGFPSPELACRMRKLMGIDFNAMLDAVDPRVLDEWKAEAARAALAEAG